MNIDEMISRLQILQQQHGNIRVLLSCEPVASVEYVEGWEPAGEIEYVNIAGR